ncbi:MAG: tRNA (guanosine(46)-N7)-methyltransferase TrmB [Salibacteraceae bacterium]|nr:tRNA (guanosine(46)-N7)-methyltransferase TrmB [Salibacteraceae bacterium]
MGKNKLKKFAEVQRMTHVIEPEFDEVMNKDYRLKGNWNKEFGNDNPIVLELACGKGEYSVGMGKLFPEKNFVGIDIKGARMFTGAKEVEDAGMTNVRFLRTKIDLINSFFAENEVDEIWILFADPQLGRPRKRLTSGMFLERYVRFLKPGGKLNLKSDSTDLYEFTKLESIPEYHQEQNNFEFDLQFDTDQLYEEGIKALDETMQAVLNIRTYYESIWLAQGKKIKYLSYNLIKK